MAQWDDWVQEALGSKDVIFQDPDTDTLTDPILTLFPRVTLSQVCSSFTGWSPLLRWLWPTVLSWRSCTGAAWWSMKLTGWRTETANCWKDSNLWTWWEICIIFLHFSFYNFVLWSGLTSVIINAFYSSPHSNRNTRFSWLEPLCRTQWRSCSVCWTSWSRCSFHQKAPF